MEESVIKLEVAVDGGQSQKKEIRVRKTPFVELWFVERQVDLRESKDKVPMPFHV